MGYKPSIPPESIQTTRLSNNEEITTLRSPQPFYKKTGHEMFNVTVTWKALVDYSTLTPDYSQWEDLRKIIAFFKAAPFIEVENAHLRQLVLAENPGGAPHDRMAFALRQLQIETLPDTADCLQATLNMSLFNYLPFTRDFGYASVSGRSVSASQSPEFENRSVRLANAVAGPF